jgi:two-component system, LytTR family, response regulator
MTYKAIIIEDEEPARQLIKSYLAGNNEVEIIGEFADGFNGVKAIDETKPDLIFLDIQMPKLSGFEVLELITHKPAVIFSTAFDEYAIRAFEINAVDYLLKPYGKDRFQQALDKAVTSIIKNEIQIHKFQPLLKANEENPEILVRVAVKTGTKVHLIQTSDILYIEADGDYAKIITRDSFYLKEKTLKYFETHLDPIQFVRMHRSCIVNINEIARIEYYDKETHIVFLKNNTKLRASTAGYKLLKNMLHL